MNKKIEAVPTWIIKDKKVEGFNDIESLDKILEQVKNQKIKKLVKLLNENNFKCYGNIKKMQKQKKIFKHHWKNVKFVNCINKVNQCINKDIKVHPTWISGNGKRYEGFKYINELLKIVNNSNKNNNLIQNLKCHH